MFYFCVTFLNKYQTSTFQSSATKFYRESKFLNIVLNKCFQTAVHPKRNNKKEATKQHQICTMHIQRWNIQLLTIVALKYVTSDCSSLEAVYKGKNDSSYEKRDLCSRGILCVQVLYTSSITRAHLSTFRILDKTRLFSTEITDLSFLEIIHRTGSR